MAGIKSQRQIRSLYGDIPRVRTEVGDESMVLQQFAEEVDINTIMDKYQQTGLFTHVAQYAGQYGDFSVSPDYKTALEKIMAADEMFSTLPAKLRDRFHNDPAEFIEFATDEKNIDALRDMGLAEKLPSKPDPVEVKVIADKTPKEGSPASN